MVSDIWKLCYDREGAFKNSIEVIIHCGMRTFFRQLFKSAKATVVSKLQVFIIETLWCDLEITSSFILTTYIFFKYAAQILKKKLKHAEVN